MNNEITLYGAVWCPACRRTKKFLQEQRVPFLFVDLDEHPEASETIAALNDGKRSIPTLVFGDGSHLIAPSNDVLADRIGLDRSTLREVYDVVVVGGGPAGLTTAIYGARERLDVLVVDRGGLGGQAGVTERFDNYPGFPEGVGGAELADRIIEQARRYGVELLPAVGVNGLERDGDEIAVALSTGANVRARAVLVATGSTYRRLGVAGEAELIGGGIHFCATCDGPFYRGVDQLLVIGGGNSALEEGLFLTQFAHRVTVVANGRQLGGSRLLQERVLSSPQMDVLYSTDVVEFLGVEEGKLRGVVVQDQATGMRHTREVPAAFVFIGLDPNAAFLDGALELDARGFIATDRNMETSLPGVFAAGDVRSGSTKQIASAVGEGAAAAIQIRHHLDSLVAMA